MSQNRYTTPSSSQIFTSTFSSCTLILTEVIILLFPSVSTITIFCLPYDVLRYMRDTLSESFSYSNNQLSVNLHTSFRTNDNDTNIGSSLCNTNVFIFSYGLITFFYLRFKRLIVEMTRVL